MFLEYNPDVIKMSSMITGIITGSTLSITGIMSVTEGSTTPATSIRYAFSPLFTPKNVV